MWRENIGIFFSVTLALFIDLSNSWRNLSDTRAKDRKLGVCVCVVKATNATMETLTGTVRNAFDVLRLQASVSQTAARQKFVMMIIPPSVRTTNSVSHCNGERYLIKLRNNIRSVTWEHPTWRVWSSMTLRRIEWWMPYCVFLSNLPASELLVYIRSNSINTGNVWLKWAKHSPYLSPTTQILVITSTLYAYEDGMDIKFRNVGTKSSHAGRLPKRHNTAMLH